VPSLIYGEQAVADFARLADFLAREDPASAEAVTTLIADAVEILATHPLLGRSTDEPHRELVISRGRTGYIALYRYDSLRDRVVVEAIRHQREAGFEE
jgi:plasmid stabilization system protein ParE